MKVITLGRYGRFAPPEGATSGYIATKGDSSIIIDFGSGCMSVALKHTDFCSVSAIILSHLHYDHMSDLYTLGYYLESRNLRIKLYCPKTPQLVLESLRQFNFDITTYMQGDFRIGDFEIKAIFAKHPVECYSLIIDGELLYTADIQNFDNLAAVVGGVKAVIGDACILESQHNENSPHISVKSLAISVPVNVQLYLAHLTYGDEMQILNEAIAYHELTEIVPQEFNVIDINQPKPIE